MSDPWLWGDGSEIAWGDGETMLSEGAAAQSSPVTTSHGGLPRRIKRQTIEKRGRTLRELFEPSARAPVVTPPLPEPAEVSAQNTEIVPRETLASDIAPLLEALTSLRVLRAERDLAQALEDDDAEVLLVCA